MNDAEIVPSRSSVAPRDHVNQVRSIIGPYPVQNARFFGSTPRGDDREGSDLDIPVERTEVTTLFDLAGLKLELEASAWSSRRYRDARSPVGKRRPSNL